MLRMLIFGFLTALLVAMLVVLVRLLSGPRDQDAGGSNEPGADGEQENGVRRIERAMPVTSEMTAAQRDRFLRIVYEQIRLRDQQYDADSGDPFEPDVDLDLATLACRCAKLPGDDWPEIIAQHLDGVLGSQASPGGDTAADAPPDTVRSWSAARPRLAIELRPMEDEPGDDVDVSQPSRIDLPGVVSALVFDMGRSFRPVTRKESDAWDLNDEALFEAALKNLRAMSEMPGPQRVPLANELELYACSGDSPLIGSLALLLDAHPELIGEHGAIVAVPTRHTLLVHPIRNRRAIEVIHGMIPMVDRIAQEGPGRVSANLYWYQNGDFTLLPCDEKDGEYCFHPPQSFARLLDMLTGE